MAAKYHLNHHLIYFSINRTYDKMSKTSSPALCLLTNVECRYYRDELRAARYAALADAEGFEHICYALEALGLRLLGEQGDMGKYEDRLSFYAEGSLILKDLAKEQPTLFKPFHALYETVRRARNDNMHSGAYARHATVAAIDLCIGLEEALMVRVRRTVGDLMVKSSFMVEPWQPIAHARQLMLMHSFSFLPVQLEGAWFLLSELGLAQFLNASQTKRRVRLGLSIEDATKHEKKLHLYPVNQNQLLTPEMTIDEILSPTDVIHGHTLWLVVDAERKNSLVGVLSPSELM